MRLLTDKLISRLRESAPLAGGYWVAYSGGLDSQVLLHALVSVREQLPAALSVIHVNHNLHTDAASWAEHCRVHCAQWQLPLQVLSVQAQPAPGESPEAAARVARYQAMAAVLPAGAVLLTAHHQDDQAETLLLQLLRGAGPKGLAAMPMRSDAHGFMLLRPLLDVSRDSLYAYAQQHALSWVDDPSNAHTDYDRNFLRHEILPQLRTRWPAAGATLARSARHQAEAAELLEQLAELDFRGQTTVSPVASSRKQLEKPWSVPAPSGKTVVCPHLSIPLLLTYSAARRANLLRYWLQQHQASPPSAAVLARIEQDVVQVAADAQPLVRWGKVRVRRYRDALYVDDVLEENDPSGCLEWQPDQPLSLLGGVLSAQASAGAGVAVRHLQDRSLSVRFRQGGESLQPQGRREHHTLKHLFQDAGVPPWERARVPLIYRDTDLLAVAGYWICAEFAAAADEPGMGFSWSRAIVPTGSFW